jgi:hypothetical protein
MHLAGQNLNKARLNFAEVICRICFRQKDFYSDLLLEDPSPLGQLSDVRRTSESQPCSWFRLSRSRIGSGHMLSGKARGRTLFLICVAKEVWAETTAAYDIVDRWRRRGPAFALNRNALGLRALTDANLTEERASFELTVDTGYPRRRSAEPLRLGRRRLNHAGLRLSVKRTHPLRLGRMALNQSGPRLAQPELRWRFRQKDLIAGEPAGFEAVANRLLITQWPN